MMASAILCWNSGVLSLASSCGLLMKAVSTSTLGMAGAFSTAKLACSTRP